jgi:hypothetical protein
MRDDARGPVKDPLRVLRYNRRAPGDPFDAASRGPIADRLVHPRRKGVTSIGRSALYLEVKIASRVVDHLFATFRNGAG